MKKYIFLALFFSACHAEQVDQKERSEKEIVQADTAMSALAEKEGFWKALQQYADDSLVKPNEGELPVIGKSDFLKKYGEKIGPKTLTWWTLKAEAARSGELGYTLGNWKFVKPDSTYYGNYVTVWKRQKDNSWKWVFDNGNNTPHP